MLTPLRRFQVELTEGAEQNLEAMDDYISHAWMFPDQAPHTTGLAGVLPKGHVGVAMDTPFNRTLFVRDLLNRVGKSR